MFTQGSSSLASCTSMVSIYEIHSSYVLNESWVFLIYNRRMDERVTGNTYVQWILGRDQSISMIVDSVSGVHDVDIDEGKMSSGGRSKSVRNMKVECNEIDNKSNQKSHSRLSKRKPETREYTRKV
jgi:hypothetical protein